MVLERVQAKLTHIWRQADTYIDSPLNLFEFGEIKNCGPTDTCTTRSPNEPKCTSEQNPVVTAFRRNFI